MNFPFLDGDVSCSTSYGVYIFQLIRGLQNFSDKDIDIIKFVGRFQNFIDGILT